MWRERQSSKEQHASMIAASIFNSYACRLLTPIYMGPKPYFRAIQQCTHAHHITYWYRGYKSQERPWSMPMEMSSFQRMSHSVSLISWRDWREKFYVICRDSYSTVQQWGERERAKPMKNRRQKMLEVGSKMCELQANATVCVCQGRMCECGGGWSRDAE